MKTKSGKIRRKSKGFAQISNDVLRNENLSLKAKGLYSLIESYLTMDDWDLYKSFLIKQCKEKETAFDGAWKELKEAGYLIQYKLKDQSTGKWIYEYELLDEPVIKNKKQEIPSKEKSYIENPGGENPGVENPCVENQGVNNNTNINNTNINNTNKKIREGKPSFPNLSDNNKLDESNIIPLKSITKNIVIPEDSDIDKYIIGLLKKDKVFKGINFNEDKYYMAFIEAIVATQIQDNVEVLSLPQWKYFRQTLLNKIKPLELERKLLGW